MEDEVIYNPYNENNKEISINIIHKILNNYNVHYNVNNIDLFLRSFVHKSYTTPILNEGVRLAPCPPNCLNLKTHSNERLEFLGDGILECVTKNYLYKRFPHAEEGFMTEKKIALVKNDHIGKLAYDMGLHKWLIISKNAEEKKIRTNYKKLGCLFEAFLGALFLDANNMKIYGEFQNQAISGFGFQVCQLFIENIFEKLVDWTALLENDDNFKNIFQVKIQKEFKCTPEYKIIHLDEELRYTMGVYLCINGNFSTMKHENAVHFKDIRSFQKIHKENIDLVYFAKGSHKIKKKAEQMACQEALKLISNMSDEGMSDVEEDDILLEKLM